MARATNANGARGGNRTHTALRPPDFESGASASSATRASDAEGRLARATVSLNPRICSRHGRPILCEKPREGRERRNFEGIRLHCSEHPAGGFNECPYSTCP